MAGVPVKGLIDTGSGATIVSFETLRGLVRQLTFPLVISIQLI